MTLLFPEFDQRPFTKAFPRFGGLGDSGLLYLPQKCAAWEICKLLVFLHGCTGGQEYTGQSVIVEAGFLPELEARGIVGLFPQIKRSHMNPYGCWDYWGYLGDNDYYTKNGVQIRILRQMIQAITGL